MTRRIVVPGLDLNQDLIDLPEQVVRHVARVLRLERGQPLLLLDGQGKQAKAVITAITPAAVQVRITSQESCPLPSTPALHLIQALPKGSGKIDEIIRRATELGVASIRPALSHRSVARPSTERARARLERWLRIVAEASRQCCRPHVPRVEGLVSLDDALGATPRGSARIMLWEEEHAVSLSKRLQECAVSKGVTLVIGPEGGFTAHESLLAQEVGYVMASLGRLVLRVETAAITACAVAQHALGALEP